jgi:ABC-2 type transport system permease protein
MHSESASLWFGFLWWCLDPLFQMAAYTLVVSVILNKGVHDFPLFVMVAMLPWQFFMRAVRNSIAQTRAKTRTMRQVAFPRAVVPLASSLSELVRLIFALALFMLFASMFGVYPAATGLLALALIPVLFTMALGFAYFFSALNLFFHDTEQIMKHVFRLWLFLSPILYSTQRVPPHLRLWFQLNPVCLLLEGFRSAMFYGQVPSLWPLAIVAGASVVVLVVGFSFFVGTERGFAKRA